MQFPGLFVFCADLCFSTSFRTQYLVCSLLALVVMKLICMSHCLHGDEQSGNFALPDRLVAERLCDQQHCSKIAEAEAAVSVNEKKWLVMHMHVQLQLDELCDQQHAEQCCQWHAVFVVWRAIAPSPLGQWL